MVMNIENELTKIERSIDVSKLILFDETPFDILLRLQLFEYTEFDELIIKLNKLRIKCSTYQEKEALIPQYKRIYQVAKKVYSMLLLNIESRDLEISFSINDEHYDTIQSAIACFKRSSEASDFLDVCYEVLHIAISNNIIEVSNELAILKNHPHDYINTTHTYIGPTSIIRDRNIKVFYKDVSITPTDSRSFSVFYNERSTENTKNAILNILSYINGSPYYYFSDNPEFNRKTNELYLNFDLLDMLRFRKKDYFSKFHDEPIFLELPILKTTNKRNYVEVPAATHEAVFALYNASLKQFEPLPRCVFLFRVFEYGAKYHYQVSFRPKQYKPEDAIEYYLSKIFAHRYTPLYYITFRKRSDMSEDSAVGPFKTPKCENFISSLKREAHLILTEWDNDNYLCNKRKGEIIYSTGRNACAHASGKQIDARYDYGKNYKHINNVNIILELIARYIIEEMNSSLSKLVDRFSSKYEEDF